MILRSKRWLGRSEVMRKSKKEKLGSSHHLMAFSLCKPAQYKQS